MNIKNYLNRLEAIRFDRLITTTEMLQEMGISYVTFKRLFNNPEASRINSLRKLKAYVLKWEDKNLSVSD